MWRLARRFDKRRKNYHSFREDEDSYYTARLFISDMEDGERMIVFLNPKQALAYGITVHDKVSIIRLDWEEIVADVSFSSKVTIWTVAVSAELAKRYNLKSLEMVGVSLTEWASITTTAIRKKMRGKTISYEETLSIIKDISENKLDDVMMTYYVASSFFYPTTDEEMYQTAKAMAECGVMFKHPKWEIVADKHCIGWVPWNETTMIAIPILASLGVKMPKNFSKAITSPAATGECVNVLMDINFDKEWIENLIKENNCCLVWWWSLDLAPADDKLIKVQYPLSMQSRAKVVSSIMAKKYAMWVTHSLIDIPVGPTAKVTTMREALDWKQKFEYVGKKLWMKMTVQITPAKEVPADLEKKAIFLAGKLIEIVGLAKGKKAETLARKQLTSWEARKMMQKIIKAQNGRNPNVQSEELKPWIFTKEILAEKSGKIKKVDLHNVNHIARRLGCPAIDEAWIYISKRLWDKVKKWDVLFTMYSTAQNKIDLALEQNKENPAMTIW